MAIGWEVWLERSTGHTPTEVRPKNRIKSQVKSDKSTGDGGERYHCGTMMTLYEVSNCGIYIIVTDDCEADMESEG